MPKLDLPSLYEMLGMPLLDPERFEHVGMNVLSTHLLVGWRLLSTHLLGGERPYVHPPKGQTAVLPQSFLSPPASPVPQACLRAHPFRQFKAAWGDAPKNVLIHPQKE